MGRTPGSSRVWLASLLQRCDVAATQHRLDILDLLADSQPLRPRDILERLRGRTRIHRVTVYRTLDLLQEKGILHRISSGERSFRYGLSPELLGRPHAHFHCTRCDRVICLSPEAVSLEAISRQCPAVGSIEHVEIRLDGTCSACLASSRQAL